MCVQTWMAMTIRLACVSACLGVQISGMADAIGQEPAGAEPSRAPRAALLNSVPFDLAISPEPVSGSRVVEPCGCPRCVGGGYYDEPVLGEGLLLECAEEVHRLKLRWKRFCQRLRHETYYPRCPPAWDECYGYRRTCWRRLPECGCCPPAGAVVLTGPWSGGEFLPPVPVMPEAGPAVVPPAPMPTAPPPDSNGPEAAQSSGPAAP
jgi:hypothetical protein